jgi:ABC-2 type transport system permease protein
VTSANTINAEWTKQRTVPGTIWLLAGSVAANHCPSGTACPVDTTKLSLTGIDLGQAVVAVLAVLTISGEYSTGMIRTMFAAMPRRSAVLAAKAALLTGLVLASGPSPCSAACWPGGRSCRPTASSPPAASPC